MRTAPESRNPTKRCGPHSTPTKVCPCCKTERGVRAFARMAKFCNDCRVCPSRAKPTGPTAHEREEARAAAEVARFDAFARKVREEAGLPRR
jgi:hypothetical protein